MERKWVDSQFGKRVKAERERHSWTQEELAKMLSDKGIRPMHAVTIAKIESGYRSVRINEALGLADLFGASLDALLGHTTDPRDDQAYALLGLADTAKRSARQVADIAAAVAERLQDVHEFAHENLRADGQRAWDALREANAALTAIARVDVADGLGILLLPPATPEAEEAE